MSLVKKLNIVVTADSICPFCYLGFVKVNKAIARAKENKLPLEFSLRWAPFQLDPTLPTDKALSKRQRMGERFGVERFEQMDKMVSNRFAEEGISISHDTLIRQTTPSQRLITKAYEVGGEEMQLKTVERIYSRHFSDGKDIGAVEVLAPVAAECGVFGNEEEAKTWLNGEEGMDEYHQGILAAQRAGIHGVPHFKINNKWAVSGAQEAETFLNVFERIASGKLA